MEKSKLGKAVLELYNTVMDKQEKNYDNIRKEYLRMQIKENLYDKEILNCFG